MTDDRNLSMLSNSSPEPEWPDWYTPSKYRPQGNLRVLRGQHPLGGELGEGTCGECKHLVRRECSKTYLKCGLRRRTKGPATDLCAKWRGCAQFESRP